MNEYQKGVIETLNSKKVPVGVGGTIQDDET
jgi:hypothetical protein